MIVADKKTSKKILGYIGAFFVVMTLVNYSIGWFTVTPNWRVMFGGLMCFVFGVFANRLLK